VAHHLSEVVAALSHALDLTQGQPEGHAGRTCLIGLRLAKDAGLDDAERSALFYGLLLKDAGCTSSSVRISTLFGRDDIALKREGKLVDWTRPSETIAYVARGVEAGSLAARARKTVRVALELARNDGIVDARCSRGAKIVLDLGFPPAASDAVRTLDEHWDGRGKPVGLEGDAIPLSGRIACLAQTAEIFTTTFGVDAARAMVRRRRGRWFDPALADLFLAIGDADPLWTALLDGHDPHRIAEGDPGPADHDLGEDDRLDLLAEAFAQVIDAKSAYTFHHSVSVADYTVAIAQTLGISAPVIRDLRRAALLHDIGKLAVPTSILDKPGRLTDEEFATIREHPRHTGEILSRVTAFAMIAPMAAAHHERLDGRGYHLALAGAEIPIGARILAVADVYDALTADRPYRAAMAPTDAIAILERDRGTAFDPQVLDAHIRALAGSRPARQAA
jgi:putative nucleotidyltransferase with HDIG domain